MTDIVEPPGSVRRRLVERYDAAVVRRWAWAQGIEVAPTGGLPRFLYELYEEAGLPAEDRPTRG